MTEQGFNPQLHNLREVIKNLEYLLVVAETPADKVWYLERIEQSRKLESMMVSGAGPS